MKRLCEFDKCAPITVRAASGGRFGIAATSVPCSANARIGVQRVAHLLSLGLSASVGNADSRVGNQLSLGRSCNAQGGLRRAASQAADLNEQQLLNRCKGAQVSNTEVVTAQASALNARRTVAQLAASRQAAAIALIQALGEHWHAPT